MSLCERLHFHTKPTVQKLDFLMANFQDLQAQVARNKVVVAQAIAALQSVPAKVAAAVAAATSANGAIDQTAFDALHADLTATTDLLLAQLDAPAA